MGDNRDMLADLTGRTALVTGGGQGLGLGIVERMAGQGADIVIADLNDENAAAAVARVEELGCKGYGSAHGCDGSAEASRKVFLWPMMPQAGSIILANNAGVSGAPGSTGVEWRDVDWEFTWRVNVKGLSDVTEAILPQMREQRYGKIINISSVAARAARYVTAYYATTKMAVIAYTQALAREYAAENIKRERDRSGTDLDRIPPGMDGASG